MIALDDAGITQLRSGGGGAPADSSRFAVAAFTTPTGRPTSLVALRPPLTSASRLSRRERPLGAMGGEGGVAAVSAVAPSSRHSVQPRQYSMPLGGWLPPNLHVAGSQAHRTPRRPLRHGLHLGSARGCGDLAAYGG